MNSMPNERPYRVCENCVMDTTDTVIVFDDKGYYFFSNGKLCMYSESPCTHVDLNNIVFNRTHNYKVFYKKKINEIFNCYTCAQ